MSSVLLVLQLIVAIFLVAVILMQRSNGGALSGLGGDSGIGGLISARGKGNILTRITAILATLFFVLSMAISIYFSRYEVKRTALIDNTIATSSLPVAEQNDVAVPVAEEEAPVAPANEQTTTEEAPVAPAEEQTTAEPQVPVTE